MGFRIQDFGSKVHGGVGLRVYIEFTELGLPNWVDYIGFTRLGYGIRFTKLGWVNWVY